jgi:hypothetical protein
MTVLYTSRLATEGSESDEEMERTYGDCLAKLRSLEYDLGVCE